MENKKNQEEKEIQSIIEKEELLKITDPEIFQRDF